jgi:biotin transport system substrate-specific component
VKNESINTKLITQKSKISIRELMYTALFSSIIVILSQIAIPMPFGVPITLQTLAIALCGYVLGVKYGLFSIIVYILLGAVGLPVFANFKGGFQAIFGMTGGFIWGFIILVTLCGLHFKIKGKIAAILLGVLGLLLCHLLGVLQFSIVTSTPMAKSLLLVSIPFLPKDIFSIIAAYFLALVLRKRLLDAEKEYY